MNVLISLTVVFEGSFTNFDVAYKEYNLYHLSLSYMLGKAEMWVTSNCFDRQVLISGCR